MLIDVSMLIAATAILLFAISYLLRSIRIFRDKPVIGNGSKLGLRYKAKIGRKK